MSNDVSLNQNEFVIKKIYKYFIDKEEVEFVYLFGSYANGSVNSMSDIDIAIYFKNECLSYDIDKYLTMKMELADILKKEIDIIILNTAKPFLKSRIINKHIKIFSRDTLIESEFVSKSLGEYFDIKPYIDMQYEKVISRMKEGAIFG